MKRSQQPFFQIAYAVYTWVRPLFDPIGAFRTMVRYPGFFKDWMRYSRMQGAEKIRIPDVYPILDEKTKTSKFDAHYFYQDIWAFRRIRESGADRHVDVGSQKYFVGFLSAITKVTFVDIRPLEVQLENFESLGGDILSLPFPDNSIPSLSCLHVAEHIGLGRYGDALDPLGTRKACRELARVLDENGNLYFSLPMGKPRVCFNAHRVHSPEQILDYFSDLELVEFSGIDDQGVFKRNLDPLDLKNEDYGCGLFWFKKLPRIR